MYPFQGNGQSGIPNPGWRCADPGLQYTALSGQEASPAGGTYISPGSTPWVRKATGPHSLKGIYMLTSTVLRVTQGGTNF